MNEEQIKWRQIKGTKTRESVNDKTGTKKEIMSE